MIEQERKFKLKYLPEGLKPLSIKQGYLMVDDGSYLRIRIIEDYVAFICYKSMISKTKKNEYEYQVPIADGLELFNSAKIKLFKIRYKTTYNNNQVDIDVYPNGLRIVEIEYENELKELPDYCGKDITGVKKYSNLNIAKNGSY